MIHLLLPRLNKRSRHSLYIMCFSLLNDSSKPPLDMPLFTNVYWQAQNWRQHFRHPKRGEQTPPSACWLLSSWYSSRLLTFLDTNAYTWLKFDLLSAKAPSNFIQKCILASLPPQVQDFAFGSVELHEIPIVPFLQHAKVALDCWTCSPA